MNITNAKKLPHGKTTIPPERLLFKVFAFARSGVSGIAKLVYYTKRQWKDVVGDLDM